MRNFYQWKYFEPSMTRPKAIDPFCVSPRTITVEEFRNFETIKKKSFEPNGLSWEPYRKFSNGDIIHHLKSEQCTDDWHLAHLGRISSSNLAECIGLSDFNQDLVSTALKIAGLYEQKRTPEELERMNYGKICEPLTKIHCETYHQCRIYDVNFLVPSWKPYLGDSPDGEVIKKCEDGQVLRMSAEFKNPKYMYSRLKERLEVVAEGRGDQYHPDDFTHIFPSHYIQCMCHMYCMNTEYCIYHVTAYEEELFYSQIIPFNPDFWAWVMHRLDIFYEYYLMPVLRNTNFPLVPK